MTERLPSFAAVGVGSDDPRLATLVARSRVLARFDGWRERIVVLEVRPA